MFKKRYNQVVILEGNNGEFNRNKEEETERTKH